MEELPYIIIYVRSGDCCKNVTISFSDYDKLKSGLARGMHLFTIPKVFFDLSVEYFWCKILMED